MFPSVFPSVCHMVLLLFPRLVQNSLKMSVRQQVTAPDLELVVLIQKGKVEMLIKWHKRS